MAENLRLVLREFTGEAQPAAALMHQVHGAEVAVVDDLAEGQRVVDAVDGLVTNRPDVTLVVRVADCVPVLVADPDAGVVAALHAGRPGLVAGIVPAGLRAMRSLGARRMVAWLGPSVCGRCYEVPAEMREQVCAVVPEAWAETSWGTPAVDVSAGVLAQLGAGGVEAVDAGRCTLEHEDLFSYRRDGSRSGRMAGLVRIRPEGAR